MLKLSINIFILSLSLSCFGQVSSNVDFQGNWHDASLPEQSSLTYNDIWGYVDEEGKEYGVIGSYGKTHFIDINDPTNPTEIARFDGQSNSLWRDFKTYLHYGYGVADNGGASLQIFDLSDLPNTVSKVFDSSVFFSNCHNIFIDEKHGRLYAVGTSVANIVVLDILTDPANPTLLANINLPDGYIHDIYVRDHIAYSSHINKGMLSVYDLSNLNANPIPSLGSINNYTDRGLNHSSWLSEDGNVMVMTDEDFGASVKVINTSDLTDMQESSTIKSTLEGPVITNSIAHNPFIIGNDYVVISYYHEGIQIYDISNPTMPERAGYYDTYDNVLYTGYEGTWGVYPFLPSKNIIASDIDNGLFVVKPTFDMGYCRDYLYSGRVVEDSENISASAGKVICLRNGFHAEAGSEFRAFIEDCSEPGPGPEPEPEPCETIICPEGIIKDGKGIRRDLQIYPNPFVSEFKIQVTETTASYISSVQLFNNYGQEVAINIVDCGTNCFNISSNNLAQGMYTVMLKKDGEVVEMKKVVKL